MSELNREVVFNPGRKQVYDITVLAINESDGEPAQTFADALVATITIGVMAEVDMSNFQDLVDRVLPNAQIAAKHLLIAMEDGPDGDG
jgi:hypothetical protein